MALLRVFLIGVFTLCTFTFIIYNFFIPEYEPELNRLSVNKQKNHLKNDKYFDDLLNYKFDTLDSNRIDKNLKNQKDQNDKLNYDQIDIYVKDDLVKESKHDKINQISQTAKSSTKKTSNAIDNILELGYINNKEEEKIREEGFRNHSFNLLISNRLGYKREISDTRHQKCRSLNYTSIDQLPKTSIIICFYNEAKSTLLRTVQSIIDRTEDQLIEEIILVNDFSDSKHFMIINFRLFIYFFFAFFRFRN